MLYNMWRWIYEYDLTGYLLYIHIIYVFCLIHKYEKLHSLNQW